MRNKAATYLLLAFCLLSVPAGAGSICDNDSNSRAELKMAALSIEERAGNPFTDEAIENTKCKGKEPSPMQLEQWLTSYADYDKGTTDDAKHRIHFEDESPKLIALFDKLTTGKNINYVFKSRCQKVLCAVKEIWGNDMGPKLLYMMGKYGLNGAGMPYGEDAEDWASDELAPALQALEDLPPGMLPLNENKKFSRFPKGMTYRSYQKMISESGANACIAGNSKIEFFDCHFRVSKGLQTKTAFHELSHYIGEELGLDTMAKWNQLSGWEETTRPNGKVGFDTSWQATKPSCLISNYAATSPIEDFAESMSAYRYTPALLKETCPEKYEFLKKMVFSDIEYTDAKLCQDRKIENGIVDKLKWHLNKLNYKFD